MKNAELLIFAGSMVMFIGTALIHCTRNDDSDEPTGLVINRVRCIELCLELSKPADDQLENSIRKCEMMFTEKECRLVP